MNQFEDELRESLRRGQDVAPDTDAMLSGVRAGARRRIRRRRVAVGMAAAAVAAATPLGYAQWSTDDAATPVATSPTVSEPAPTRASTDTVGPTVKDRTLTAAPVEPVDVTVTSMTAMDTETMWVYGHGTCDDDRCTVLGRSDNEGQTFTFHTAPGPAALMRDVRFASDGENGWIFGNEVWSTHDAGATWQRIELPGSTHVGSIQPWSDQVWAFSTAGATGPQDPGPVHLSRLGSDNWTRVDHDVLGVAEWLRAPFVTRALDDDIVAGGLVPERRSYEVVTTDDGGATWHRAAYPCGNEPLSSAARHAVWVMCPGEDRPLQVSGDPATGFAAVEVEVPQDGIGTLGSIDPAHALVTTGGTALLVDVDADTPQPVEPLDPAPSRYTYAGFTSPEVGYLIAADGRIARTDDGGQTWSELALP